MGVIEKTNSSYNTPLMCVRKANNQIRIVQNFAATINKVVELPGFPIPNIRLSLKKISDFIATIKNVYKEEVLISCMDISNGFHTIPIRKRDRDYFAFMHNNIMWTYSRMSMGERGAPSNFCLLMDSILGSVSTEKTKVFLYLDDILIVSCRSDALKRS